MKQNTKLLMAASAVVMMAVGIACSFAPVEILGYMDVMPAKHFQLVIQLFGAIYLGFGLLNWMAKANVIGGIYSKPVAIGNFMHFVVSTLALIKYFAVHTDLTILLVPISIYAIFAIWFGKITFSSPV